jgi:hypothetical protein
MPKFLIAALLAAFCYDSAVRASDLLVTLAADVCDASTIVVGPGCEVVYRVIGELSDSSNRGLAVVVFDLEFDGGALPQASEPTGLPMLNFVPPLGFAGNPSGYGGTPDDGRLLQVGGAQNVFNHGQWLCDEDDDCPSPSTCVTGLCTDLAGLPVGALITDVASPGSPAVLATGTLTAPSTEGTYTLQVTNLKANLVILGATGDPMWATEAAGVGTITNLLVTVQDGAACCDQILEACCLPDGGCGMVRPDDCVYQFGGLPQGPGSTCEDDSDSDSVLNCADRCPGADDLVDADENGIPDCLEHTAIPTLAEWGLAALTLLLLTGGRIVFGGRHRRVARVGEMAWRQGAS